MAPVGVGTLQTTSVSTLAVPVPRNGQVRDLTVTFTGTQGDGDLVCTLRKNNADTNVIAVIPAGSSTSPVHSATQGEMTEVSQGDLLLVGCLNEAIATSVHLRIITFLFD